MINSSRTFACRQITHGTYICSLQVSSHGSHSSNQPRDQLCSALSCPDSAVGCSDPTLGIPSCCKGNKAKTSKSNRESWKEIEIERNALPLPQSNQRIGTGNRINNEYHAAAQPSNPATLQRAATQYHRTTISDLDEAYTYVHTIDYTLAYAALHCIAAKTSGRNLCTTGSRRQEPANRDPPQTWGDSHLFQLTSHPIPSSLLHVSIPCFSSSSLHCRTGTTGPCLHCISIHAPHLSSPLLFRVARICILQVSFLVGNSNLALHGGDHGR